MFRTGHPFYVDTRAEPPRSIWVHPYDDPEFQRQSQSQSSSSTRPPIYIQTPGNVSGSGLGGGRGSSGRRGLLGSLVDAVGNSGQGQGSGQSDRERRRAEEAELYRRQELLEEQMRARNGDNRGGYGNGNAPPQGQGRGGEYYYQEEYYEPNYGSGSGGRGGGYRDERDVGRRGRIGLRDTLAGDDGYYDDRRRRGGRRGRQRGIIGPLVGGLLRKI